MSQRDSGYARKERDLYETPPWVTQTLVPHIPARVSSIWEPAAATGKMATVLNQTRQVQSTDIDMGCDFLEQKSCTSDAIITNPPYELAREFIEHAIHLTASSGFVAMLLRTDYDHAATRANLFSMSPRFAKKVVLRKRIKWFEDSDGSPSFNHAWFIWDWQHQGAPTLAYAP